MVFCSLILDFSSITSNFSVLDDAKDSSDRIDMAIRLITKGRRFAVTRWKCTTIIIEINVTEGLIIIKLNTFLEIFFVSDDLEMAGSCSWKYIGTLDLTNLLCKMLVKLTLSIPLLWKWRVGKDYLLFGRYSLREKDTVVIPMDRLRSGLYRIHIRSTIRYIALYLLLFCQLFSRTRTMKNTLIYTIHYYLGVAQI